ncbi:UNVERIFIED_ORG: hypothetical protein ABIC97_005404 [Peribacillus simplex]
MGQKPLLIQNRLSPTSALINWEFSKNITIFVSVYLMFHVILQYLSK